MGKGFRLPIIFLAMLILHFSYGQKRKDFSLEGAVVGLMELSNACMNNRTINIFLTYGMGISDSVVIIFTATVCLNCKINIKTDENIFLLMTVEFPNINKGKIINKSACFDSSNKLMISYGNETNPATADICALMSKNIHLTYSFFISYANEANITITCNILFESIKITVTSAKAMTENHECIANKEQTCRTFEGVHKGKRFCFTTEVQCDGNMNCVGIYDESAPPCTDSENVIAPWLLGLIVIIITVSTIFVIVRIILSLPTPKKKDTHKDEEPSQCFMIRKVHTSLKKMGGSSPKHVKRKAAEPEVQEMPENANSTGKDSKLDVPTIVS